MNIESECRRDVSRMDSEMTNAPDLAEWNHQVLILVQALVGAVSPNFRMVTLGHDGQRWHLRFFLEEDRFEDREEIEDILCQYEAMQDQGLSYDFEVRAGSNVLPSILAPERVVFRRREP